jgi:urate oxidase
MRTAVVTTDDSSGERRVWVVSGVQDLVILKSTGSGFKGFLKDKYTTLQETEDRIMATSLTTRWRYEHTNVDDWNKTYDDIKRTMLEVFASTYSEDMQQSLYLMGKAVLESGPEFADIKFSAPNKHHFSGRPVAVRRGEQQRGLHRRRPALRPHRGLRCARGRLRPR